MDNNVEFFMHTEGLWHHVENIPWIESTIEQRYRNIIKIIMGPHYIYIQARQDLQNQWLTTKIRLPMEAIDVII